MAPKKKPARKPQGKAKAKPKAKAAAKSKHKGTGRPAPKKTKGTTRRKGSGKRPGDGDSKGIPKGRGLTAAEKSLRDSLILQRRAQGWTWDEVSKEIGLSVSQCKRAAAAKKKTMMLILDRDPVEVVKNIIEGFEASIGDLEKMATEYAQHHPSAAVGAKKGADEARRNLIVLLQSIGFLPNELGTIRWVVEVRQIVELLTGAVVRFESRLAEMELPDDARQEVEAEAGELRKALKEAASQSG